MFAKPSSKLEAITRLLAPSRGYVKHNYHGGVVAQLGGRVIESGRRCGFLLPQSKDMQLIGDSKLTSDHKVAPCAL